MVDILIVGSGGREHALGWALRRSPTVGKLFFAPGNAGTAALGENLSTSPENIPAIVKAAQQTGVGLVVIGPEIPLAAGIVDALNAVGIRAFGPTRAAAELESSKAFAKAFMVENNIPTAQHASFTDYISALKYLETCKHPVVVKADGLAAGKGVIMCETRDDAAAAVSHILRDSSFGAAGNRVVIEERLTGPELSVLAFCDGKTAILMPVARDHKRIFDGDKGPNTGGMGVIAPVPNVSSNLMDEIQHTVIEPVLTGMVARGTPFVGVLFAGLMLTPDGIRTLEYNCRFGDPETQAILPLLQTDLLAILQACIDGQLHRQPVVWSDGACAAIVIAAHNYPGTPRQGDVITLPDTLPAGAIAFHAGTGINANGALVTAGGRVLAISAAGADLDNALASAYQGVEAIWFDGMQFRRDIGRTGNAYARAGVDIGAGTRATELMKESVRSTYNRAVLSDTGSFGGLYDASALKEMVAPVLVASTDGVGTKTMVAARMNRWDTIGQDLVNHCVNDILVQAARPLFFLDYVASSKLNPEQIASVVAGVAQACREVGCVLLGGETAEMPGVYQPGELDLAGTLVGVVERSVLLDGSTIQVGDVILALPSNGLHTNGYSLARLALGKLDWDASQPELGGQSIGAALLAVHRPYLAHFDKLTSAGVIIRGLAHITGGGVYDNLPRILPNGAAAMIERGTWPEPPIFGLIARHSGASPQELFHALNMGLGMLVVVPPEHVEVALSALAGDCYHVGRITSGSRAVTVENLYG
jgi:phosphoribosylamine--glycine ligase/phosphoribosylformylglycinamidine cyclo-ligase